MEKVKSFPQLLAQTGAFLMAGQFLTLASKVNLHIQNRKKMNRRREGLSAHGSSILRQVMEVCRRSRIRPHLTFGTLLGYRRNNGLIKGDDDLDFGLLASDRPDIKSFAKAMEPAGFEFKDRDRLKGPLAVIGDHCVITFIHRATGISVDFYFHHTWNEEVVFVGAKEMIGYLHEGLLKYAAVEPARVLGYALSYPGDLAQNFTPANFFGCEVLVPAQTDAYLERIYGDWQIPQKKFFYKNVSAIVAKASPPGIELIRLPAPSAPDF